MRRFHIASVMGLGIVVLTGCTSLQQPRHLRADANSAGTAVPTVQRSAALLSEPRYVRADRPDRSPLSSLVQNRAPWAPGRLGKAPAEPAPFAPVAPILQGRDAPPRPLFDDAPLERRYSALTGPMPLIVDRPTQTPPKAPAPPAPVAEVSTTPPATPPTDESSTTTAKMCWESAQELEKHGMRDQALRQYAQAVELDPSYASRAARHSARLHDQLNHTEKAWRAYQSVLQDSPNDPDLLSDIGSFYSKRDAAAEAERWYRMALQYSPEHVGAWRGLGIALAAQGKVSESLRAIPHIQRDNKTLLAIGEALEKAGKKSDAEIVYRQALAIDPNDAAAKSHIDSVAPPAGIPAPVLSPAIRATGKNPF